mmetsp:Transcript_54041/g.95997  ORF Transcript_54041/g.95997 Transcript_54041/m.95997 type:complete len:225 (-) Transcript_54041:39-713(-)
MLLFVDRRLAGLGSTCCSRFASRVSVDRRLDCIASTGCSGCARLLSLDRRLDGMESACCSRLAAKLLSVDRRLARGCWSSCPLFVWQPSDQDDRSEFACCSRPPGGLLCLKLLPKPALLPWLASGCGADLVGAPGDLAPGCGACCALALAWNCAANCGFWATSLSNSSSAAFGWAQLICTQGPKKACTTHVLIRRKSFLRQVCALRRPSLQKRPKSAMALSVSV